MRKLFAGLALAAALCACSTTQTAQVQAQIKQAVELGCTIDGQFQPLAAAAVQAAGPLVTTANPAAGAAVVAAAQVDQALVHPAVVAACKALSGTPAVSVTPAN